MKLKRIALIAAAVVAVAWVAIPGAGSASTAGPAIPHYQHIVEIMMENTSYDTIIGNPLAPHINALASKYGLATDYFGVTHPSEPNYVANLGGSFFGIQDDNQFYCTPALSSKHNPFLNFAGTQGALANMVPDTQLATDLASNSLPNFSLVVPDQCHDMHGTGGCSTTNGLISAGDAYVRDTVKAILHSKAWHHGNDAVVITWDEDDFSDEGQPGTGCCGADPGGGHVATIVITNKGNKHPITDGTPYNHYSLLLSLEDAFGLPCLANACDSADGVVPMTPLFHP